MGLNKKNLQILFRFLQPRCNNNQGMVKHIILLRSTVITDNESDNSAPMFTKSFKFWS